MYFRGPERFLVQSETWVPYRWPDIIAAEIDASGERIPLRENVLCVVYKPPEAAYVWLSFSSHETVGGRWYNKRCPLARLVLNGGNRLEIATQFGQRAAILRIWFSPSGAHRFRAALAAAAVPAGESETP